MINTKKLFLTTLFALLLVSSSQAREVEEFNSDSTWTAPDYVDEIELLVVGGGGGGGNLNNRGGDGGGGGAGEVYYSSSYAVSPGNNYQIDVGGGGSPLSDGADSSFGSITAIGGGHGGGNDEDGDGTPHRSGNPGGSGGGSRDGEDKTCGGDCAPGGGDAIGSYQGHKGGFPACTEGAGGGGAGEKGEDSPCSRPGNGGDGVSYDITGSTEWFGGGGGGGGERGTSSGGRGGGADESNNGVNGKGGGGAGCDNCQGGYGGSGTVILSYPSNAPPETPSNPSPNDGSDPLEISPTLSVDVSDPNGDSMDVTFYVDTDNDGNHEYTDTDTSVTSGGTASTSLSSLSESQVVDWYVVADDGSETTRGPSSGDWSFTTVGSPYNPSNPSPSDGSVDVSLSKNLQVDVNHPDNLDMNVDFSMDGNYIGEDTVTGGSGTASVNPSLGFSEDHSWSVDVDTQGYQTSNSGGPWSFETVHNTGLNSISGPSNDPAPLNPELEASVFHTDPSEQLTVEFVNDDNGNVICSQSGVTDTDTVTCDPSGEAFADSTGTTYNWRVDLSGDQASESHSSGVQSFDTVSAPTVTLSSPNDGAENVATDSSLVADVSQAEGLQMKTKITLEDDQGNFIEDDSINSNNGQVSFSNPNLQLSENYQWYADTQLTDSAYSQSDTSSTRTFSTEHDFRVDGVYPSDDREAVGVNDTFDVEVFHSSDRNIDVEFYFGETASGTPDVTKTVTSSGAAVNATVDTGNFDGFGEETGTTYNWSYVVSDGASDTSNISEEGLNFTTVHRPELSLNSPTDSETNVDIGGSLDIGVQQDDNIATGVTAQLNNASGSEVGTAVRSGIIGTGAGTTASFSLDNFDFVEAGETYNYNATGQINNPGDAATIQGSTGVNTFTVSEKPEVTGITPIDGEKGIDANPRLNATVDHEANDQITVEFYDWEKTGSEAFLGEETVAAGDTASIDISDEEIGNDPEVYRWYVNITTESGTSWNNSANPYEFTVASITSVDYNANVENGINLNPNNADEQGLDTIIGQETITYEVSNDIDANMPGIAFNVSDGTSSEVFGEVNDVESGSSVTVDLGDSSLIEEDQDSYEIFAFYRESGTDFTGSEYRSNNIEFSTHVAEVQWVDPGQPGNRPISEYRVYHNDQSGQMLSSFDYIGSINDDSGSYTVGVANSDLGESTSNECFRLTSWNSAGESDPTSEQCVGVVP